MAVEKIGVVGAGQMGTGIAHVLALAGYDVVLDDINKEALSKAVGLIEKNMQRQEHKGIIKEEQINTIFEPYFTTKTTGTGLGLAMVKQIIAGHNGDIYIEKTSEKGTTMVVRLPLKP